VFIQSIKDFPNIPSLNTEIHSDRSLSLDAIRYKLQSSNMIYKEKN